MMVTLAFNELILEAKFRDVLLLYYYRQKTVSLVSAKITSSTLLLKNEAMQTELQSE